MPPSLETYRLLIVDQNPALCHEVRQALADLPVEVLGTSDGAHALDVYKQFSPKLVLLDRKLNGEDQHLLQTILAADSGVELVLTTDHWTEELAVESVEKGASELLAKPLDTAAFRQLILGFVEQAKTRKRTYELDNELLDAYQFQGIVGRSPAMLQVFSKLRRVAPYFQTVLVTGPTGTGKELIAHALHRLSPHDHSIFTVCNCSALVESLLESELFGHVKGAFTGALQDKIGLFEYANGGTVFLDEIGELSSAAQAKLLRVLQNHELQRVGSPVTRKVNVRVIAATHRDLRKLAAEGRFRKDLFYRLSMLEIQLPSLADRKEDLPLLQRYFLKRFSARYEKPIKGISRRAQLLLARYPWPGNVRELENVIGNACMMTDGDIIDTVDLPETLRQHSNDASRGDPGLITLAELQQRHLEYVLARLGGNKAQAAEVLGVSRATVYEMLSRLRDNASKSNLSA